MFQIPFIALAAFCGVAVAAHYAPSADAHYDFAYAVHDPQTADIKSQQESRRGDTVRGRYELIDSDGYKRTVDYTADAHNGFNAVVQRVPTDIRVPVPATTTMHYQHQPHQPQSSHRPMFNWHAQAAAENMRYMHRIGESRPQHNWKTMSSSSNHGAAHVRVHAPGITMYQY